MVVSFFVFALISGAKYFANAQDKQCQIAGDISANVDLSLGACDSNGTRQLKYRINPGQYECRLQGGLQASLRIPSIVDSNACSASCSPGSALTIPTLLATEAENTSAYCEQCPANTYSVGGGKLIQNWKSFAAIEQSSAFPFPFETSCYGFDESRYF